MALFLWANPTGRIVKEEIYVYFDLKADSLNMSVAYLTGMAMAIVPNVYGHACWDREVTVLVRPHYGLSTRLCENKSGHR